MSLVSPTYLNVGRRSDSLHPDDVRGGLSNLRYNLEDPYTAKGQGQGLKAVKSLYNATPLYTALGRPDEQAISSAIAKYYNPFHDTLEQRVESNLEKFGYSLVYDVHSMPSVGTSFEPDHGKNRPDIIIGDNHGLSNRRTLSLMAYDLAKEFGLSVEMNTPYFGGYITQKYARTPVKSYEKETFGYRGSEAIQVEFNRRSFGLNEETLEISDKEAFFYFQAFNSALIQRMSEYVRDAIPAQQLASP